MGLRCERIEVDHFIGRVSRGEVPRLLRVKPLLRKRDLRWDEEGLAEDDGEQLSPGMAVLTVNSVVVSVSVLDPVPRVLGVSLMTPMTVVAVGG